MPTFNRTTGPRPSKKLLQLAATMARPESDTHLVVAMAMRPNGVTQTEVIKLLGHPHRNKIKQLLADEKVKRYVLPESTRSTRIRLVPR